MILSLELAKERILTIGWKLEIQNLYSMPEILFLEKDFLLEDLLVQFYKLQNNLSKLKAGREIILRELFVFLVTLLEIIWASSSLLNGVLSANSFPIPN